VREAICIITRDWWALTRGRKYPILEEDEAERRVRVCGDDGQVRWSPMYCFDLTGDSRSLQPYTLWIEAEHWEPGSWNPSDGNSDVIVTFADGTRWVASFFSYANIASLTRKNQITGECLSGKYFWASDMLLVDEVSRPRIEEVVAHLVAEGKFEWIFTPLPPEEEEEAEPDVD